MRPAWEHLQSYPVALAVIGNAVAAWNNFVRLLTEMKRLFPERSPALLDITNPAAVSVARDILRDMDSLPKSEDWKKPDMLPRYETLLSAWDEMVAAEKRANFAVREVVVLLRNGTPLGGTCELGY